MIDHRKLLEWRFDEIRQTLTERDAMLYALGIGLGTDPVDRRQLPFVYEKNLQVMPSIASILCYPGNWLNNPATGVDYVKVVNGGTHCVLHRPIRPGRQFLSTPRVLDVVDKGRGKGALVRLTRDVYEEEGGTPVCTVTTTSFCRGDGGFGGPTVSDDKPPFDRPPETAPDAIVPFTVPLNQALIYRLSGDINPLHADPDVARAAGFDRPILHGLSTFGIATHAIVAACCDYEAHRVASIRARYTSVVFPGDTLHTHMWRNGATVHFRCLVPAREAVALDYGEALLQA